jgi:hypothetical protein
MNNVKIYIILFSIYLNLFVFFSYLLKLGKVSYRQNINELYLYIFIIVFLIINGILSCSILRNKSRLIQVFGIIFYFSNFIHWIITTFIIILFLLWGIISVLAMDIKL